MEERRQFIRDHSRLTTVYKNCETGEVRRGLTKNISAVGLCLVTEGSLELNTRLELEIRFPDGTETVTCMAEVVWTRPTDPHPKSYKESIAITGVKFVKIDPEAKKNLVQYAKMNALMSGGGEAPGA